MEKIELEYIHKPGILSLLRPDVFVSLLLLVVTLLAFRHEISIALSGVEEQPLNPYKFFMLGVSCLSFLTLLIYGCSINRDNIFLWFAVLYVVTAVFSTAFSNLYPLIELPFKSIRMSYWAWVMIISYFSVLHMKTFKFHVAVVLLFLPVLFYFFYVTMSANRGGGGISGLVLNPVFYIYFFMPVVLLVKSKTIKAGGALLVFAAVLISYKRSAMFSFVTAIPVYFCALIYSGSNAKLKKLIPIILGAMISVLLFAFSFKFLSGVVGIDWADRLEGVTTDRGSGRLDIWLDLLGLMRTQSAYHWIVGNGYYATDLTSLSWAHNDFLEVLYDFGLFGLTFYLLFIGQLARIFFEMKKLRYKHFDAFSVSLVIFFWGSMFSQLVILPYWFLSLPFFWGWVIADFHNAKRSGDPEKIGGPPHVFSCDGIAGYEDGYGYEYEGTYIDEFAG